MPGKSSIQMNMSDHHSLSDRRQHYPQSQGLPDFGVQHGTTEPSPELGNVSYYFSDMYIAFKF